MVQFEQMCKEHKKHIAEDMIDKKLISTVWLGLSHQYFSGPPLLFETMIFDTTSEGEYSLGENIYCDRYSTFDEAMEGHKKACEWVKAPHNNLKRVKVRASPG